MVLEDFRAPTQLKLALLWAATMFCYVYGDYFGLYVPGTVANMERGIIGPLGQATSGVLIGVSLMMAIPALMVALSVLLPARLCRWACVVLGLAYTAIMAMTLPGSPQFYQLFGAIEMALTLGIAIVAFLWPKVAKGD